MFRFFSFLVCLRPTSTSLYSTQHQQRILEIVVKTKKKSRGGFNLFNNTKKMRERDRKKSTPEYNIHENISFFPFSLSLSFSFFSLVKRKILSISRFLAMSFFLCFLNIQLSNNNQERKFLSLWFASSILK